MNFLTVTTDWLVYSQGEVLRILIDGDDQMGAKIKIKKLKKSLDQKLTAPQKSHAEFPSLELKRCLHLLY